MGLLKGNNAPYDTFLFRSAARPKDWAQRNKVDLRDLHIRNVGGQRVEVGIRKSAYDTRENYDNRHGQRRDGFWR